MQIKKDTIHAGVLAIAREEFLKKGFKDANMRVISRKAGVSLSNIYNYFSSKDALFQEVLAPTIAALGEIIHEHNNKANLTIDIFESQEFIMKYTRLYMDLILKHKGELRILLFKSHGSSLEDFKERYIELFTQTGLEYLLLMKERHPQINIAVSDFFIHIMSSMWISILGELVTHDLDRQELEKFISEYIVYGTAGWKKLMHVG
ncbi:MAG: TetR/AcrR family transcriptional regulator [Thermodesulfobacteriota bacterium]